MEAEDLARVRELGVTAETAADQAAERVQVRRPVGQGPGLGQQATQARREGGRGEHPAPVAREVLRCRQQGARRERHEVVPRRGLRGPLAAHAIAAHPPRHQRRVVAAVGVGHAERIEHVLLQVGVVVLAAGLLDDQAEEVVAGVRVTPARAGRELQRKGGEVGHHLVARPAVALEARVQRAVVRVVRDAGGVVEQAGDRHVAGGALVVRQPLADGVVEREDAAVHHLQGGQRGERLGDRADGVHALAGGGTLLRHVGEADGEVEDRLALAVDEHRHGRRRGVRVEARDRRGQLGAGRIRQRLGPHDGCEQGDEQGGGAEERTTMHGRTSGGPRGPATRKN